jgi:hypothetical protein
MRLSTGRCLIERNPEIVDSWLKTLPGSKAEARIVRAAEPRFSACFDPAAHTATWLQEYDVAGVRAGLVRAYLQAMRDRLPVQPPVGNDRAAWYSGSAEPSAEVQDGQEMLAAEIGMCLVRKHWASVVKLVTVADPKIEQLNFAYGITGWVAAKRKMGAADEVLDEIIPFMAECVPSGTRLAIDRPRLHSLLEEAAYHIMVNSGPAAPIPN